MPIPSKASSGISMIPTMAHAGPPSALRDRILAATRQAPSPVRVQVVRNTRALVVLGMALALTIFFAIGGLHLGHRPAGFVAMTAAGWATASVVVTWIAFVRGPSMLGRTRRALLAVALLTAPLLFAWGTLSTVPWPEVRSLDSDWSNYLGCFAWTGLMGLAPLAALVLARRGTDPVHPRATGAALGAAMGAWAGTLIDLRCICASVAHMAFSHALPAILLALFAAIVAPRILGF